MTRIYQTIAILLPALIFTTPVLLSQNTILPPQPLCLSGDTLFWELPNNTCGTFNAYEIYRSTNANGPYALIASISTPLTTQFVDPNPLSETRYYYMISNYNCPGWNAPPSDTISNEFPNEVLLQFVTVNNDEVYIQWSPNGSPQTIAYLVYRQMDNNVNLIDTVFNALQYTDSNASPSNHSETYYLLALDACGNTSAFVAPHSTIFLQAEQDFCKREMQLQWNEYTGWPEGVSNYRIWVSRDGAAYEAVADLPQGSTSYIYPNLINESEYCFYIEAMAAGMPFNSSSNVVCLSANTAPVPTQLALRNATVLSNHEVQINWQWDTSLNYQNAWLMRNGSGTLPLNFAPPLTFDNTYTDQQAKPGEAPQQYALNVTNECEENFPGGQAQTVFLQAAIVSAGVQLEWTAFSLSNAEVLAYNIYKEENGSLQLLQQTNPGSLNFTDESARDFSLHCYRIEADYLLNLPDGSTFQSSSWSNTACAAPKVQVYLPNAFAPEGVNNRFKPGLPASDIVLEYRLQIFDRYGQLVFETNSPQEGWDGSFRGRSMPMDTYVYYLRLVTFTGEVIEKKGSLVLIR